MLVRIEPALLLAASLGRSVHRACPGTATQRRGYNASEPRKRSHLSFALRRSGNKIALWPMTISPKAGVTGTFCEG